MVNKFSYSKVFFEGAPSFELPSVTGCDRCGFAKVGTHRDTYPGYAEDWCFGTEQIGEIFVRTFPLWDGANWDWSFVPNHTPEDFLKKGVKLLKINEGKSLQFAERNPDGEYVPLP